MPDTSGMPPSPNVRNRTHLEGDNSPMDPNSRQYRKRNADTAFNRQRGTRVESRPQSAHAMSPSVDTSDSTDTESIDRRTRNRRRYLEKAKSSSMHNLAMDSKYSVESDQNHGGMYSTRTDLSVADSSHHPPVHAKSDLSATDSTHHAPVHAKTNSLDNTHINVSSTSSNASQSNRQGQRRKSDLQMHSPVKRDDSHSSDKPNLYRKNNSSANNSTMSSRSSSMSDVRNSTKLSRHMSQLSLSDGAQEVATHHRRNHVIYHYTMMQLNMTDEVEKFVQDIVSYL